MHAWDGPERRPHRAEIKCRDAEEADFEDLLELWRELMDLHVSLDPRFSLSEQADQRFYSYLDTARSRDDYRVRVATLRARPIGFAISCILPNSPVYRARWIGYINDLCVTSDLRRCGVGQLLVDDAVTWLLDCGAESVEVYVAHANQLAQRFWRQRGGQDYLDRLSLDLGRYGRGEPTR